jgi:hypothetical protein
MSYEITRPVYTTRPAGSSEQQTIIWYTFKNIYNRKHSDRTYNYYTTTTDEHQILDLQN